MHMPVALGEVGSGVADAVAAGSEGVGDLIDRGAETPREEAPPGIVQPRLGFAPALIDHKSVRLDHRVAHGLGGLGKLGEGTPRLFGDEGVTVAAGNSCRHGAKRTQRALDGKGGNEAGHTAGDKPCHRTVGHGRKHRNQAGAKHRQRNPQAWQPIANADQHDVPSV
jgi:hypothetical protein